MGTNNNGVITATTNHNILQGIAKKGITKNALAEIVGIPKTTFNRKIDGKTDFTIPELGAIAEALGVGLLDILPAELLTARRAA